MTDLKSLIAAIEALREPAALATLVRVTGSSYRRPGARMVFGAQGLREGLISAGCLEADVFERLDSVLADRRPQRVVYAMGSDLDRVWGTGMGCQGTVEVLLERVDPGPAPAWMHLCQTLLVQRVPAVVMTVFADRGLGLPLGSTWVSGPDGLSLLPSRSELREALEPIAAAASRSEEGTSATVGIDGAEADFLVAPVLPPMALWLYGAGEPSRPLARLAHELGWFVGIADHRPALATAERFPEAERIVLGFPWETLPSLPWDRRSAALVLSHVADRDQEALSALWDAPLGYLGLQGNRTRCSTLEAEAAKEHGSRPPNATGGLHGPAGLDLGAETPEAIALSMLAEIQATLTGRPATPLRDKEGPIHEAPPTR